MSKLDYFYDAEVLHIVDADTIDFRVDLGLNVFANIRTRLHRIDAWEVRGDEREKGLEATTRVRELIPEGTHLTINTIRDKKGKYGRYLVEVFTPENKNINNILLNEGHAVEYGTKNKTQEKKKEEK